MQELLSPSDVLPLPSSSTFEDWVHQQEQCLCLLLGLGVGEDDVFPCLALPHRCCEPVSCVLCPQLDKSSFAWAGVAQNSACSKSRTGAMGAVAGVALQCPVPTLQCHPRDSHSLSVSLQLQQPQQSSPGAAGEQVSLQGWSPSGFPSCI